MSHATIQGSNTSSHIEGGNKSTTASRRRYWSKIEDETLISAVKSLIVDGWKAGNGWRDGFYKQVEMRIRKQLPGSDIKGQPHVLSRLTTWKKEYHLLALLYGRSGQGMSADHTIDVVGTEIWEAHVRTNPDLMKMRGKSYPYFEQWRKIFGNDHAIGEAARDTSATILDYINAAQNVNDQIPTTQTEIPLPAPHSPMNEDNDDADSGIRNSPNADKADNSSRKKRKTIRGATVDRLVSMMDSFMTEINYVIHKMADAITSLKEVDPAVAKVFKELESLTEFSIDNRVVAATKIVSSQTHVALFFSMDLEGKRSLVKNIINKVM